MFPVAAFDKFASLLVGHVVPVASPVGTGMPECPDAAAEEKESEEKSAAQQLAEEKQSHALPEAYRREPAGSREYAVP